MRNDLPIPNQDMTSTVRMTFEVLPTKQIGVEEGGIEPSLESSLHQLDNSGEILRRAGPKLDCHSSQYIASPAVHCRLIDGSSFAFRNLFGYQLLSGPFDDPIQRVSVCFLGRGIAGDISIELVAPLGDDSPVHRTLMKWGNSAYHACYEVPDLDQALAHLAANGCVIVSKPVPAVAFGNRRIAWLYTPARQLIEAVER